MTDVLAPPNPDDRVVTWRIEWQGRSFGWEDVTVNHLAIVALLCGHDEWESLGPHQVDPTTGYMMAAYLLTAFLVLARADERGIDASSDDDAAASLMAEVLAEVRQIRAADLADAVHYF